MELDTSKWRENNLKRQKGDQKKRAGFLYIVQRTFGEQRTKEKKRKEEGEDEDDGDGEGFEVLLGVGNSCGSSNCGGSDSVIAAPCAVCIVY